MITPIYTKDNKALTINGKPLTPNMQWKLKETVTGPETPHTYNISFISNNLIFSRLSMGNVLEDSFAVAYYKDEGTQVVYNNTLKFDDTNPYRILYFLEAPSAELTAWLLANGIKE